MKYLIRRIVSLFLNMKIRWKIICIFLVIGMVPFLLYIVLTHDFTNKILTQREASLTESSFNQAIMSVENHLETYNNLSNYMFNNTSILQILNTEYQEDYFKMYKAYQDIIVPLFQTYYALHPDLTKITVYSSCDLNPYNGYILPLDKLTEESWFPLVDGNYVPTWTVASENGIKYLYSTRLIGDMQKYSTINYLCLKVNYEQLFKPLLNVSSDSYDVLIMAKNGEVIYSTSEKVLTAEEITSSNSPNMYLSSTLASDEWTAYYYKSRSSFVSYVSNITKVTYAFGWIILSFLGILALVISLSIVTPIETLIAKIKEVKNGDMSSLTVQMESKRQDEIGVLFNNFSHLMSEIQHYIEANWKSELEKNTYQQKILYAQINPHFLYNSLSIINSKAIISGQDEISRMVILLSTFYRTALNKGKEMTTIENELTNVRSYVDIQLLSYSEPIQIQYDIASEVLSTPFPNFILQPLVENALDHGLKNSMKQDKSLCISVKQEDRILYNKRQPYIVIELIDNGIGMTESMVQSLFELQTSGYGIKNVNDRLKLLYNENYQLTFTSILNKGTTAVLVIPL